MHKTLLLTGTLLIFIGCQKERVTDPVTEPVPKSLAEVFTSFTYSQLESLPTPVETRLVDRISRFFTERFNVNPQEHLPNDPQGIILFGLFYAAAVEKSPTSSNNNMRTADTWGCFMTAVSTVIGISDAKALWASLQAGATSNTVIAAFKLIAKRAASAIGVGLAVVGVMNCLGWMHQVPVIEGNEPHQPTLDMFDRYPLIPVE